MLSFLFGKTRVKRKTAKKVVAPKRRKVDYLNQAMKNAPTILAAAGLVGGAVAAAKNKPQIKKAFNDALKHTRGGVSAVKTFIEASVNNPNMTPEKVKVLLSIALNKVKASKEASMGVAAAAVAAVSNKGDAMVSAVHEVLAKYNISYEAAMAYASRGRQAIMSRLNASEFGRMRRRRIVRKMNRKPPAKLIKQCKRYRIKVTMKRGSKRVYKSVAVLKRQLRKKMRKLKK